MNLNPLRFIPDAWWPAKSSGRKDSSGRNLTAREVAAQGPWTNVLSDWVAREVAPRLYEALREAIPPIDAAINRLVTLDGIIRARGDNGKLVAEIEDFIENVPVNDLQTGMQTFYALQGNEMYEQGCTVGEFRFEKNGRDIERLWVADSKGIYFRRADGGIETWYSPPSADRGRKDGTDQVERVLRNSYRTSDVLEKLTAYGYRQLDPARIVYGGFNNEADGPYGVSLMRSMEFCARVLLTIDNSTLQTWERFGNPSFDVLYKTKARLAPEDLETRRKTIADNLSAAMAAKRAGNAVDFVNAVAKDDDLTLKVIGHDNQVLEIEQPARHVLEQIVSKTGLPSWMLGFHWSTAERLAQAQGVMVLQESKTRFAGRLAGLNRIVETMLRARGRTWKRGDWELYQELPNLQDIVAQAQANFLNMQAEMMGRGTGIDPTAPAPDLRNGARLARVTSGGKIILPTDAEWKAPHRHSHKVESYVEDAPALMRLERRAERALLSAWDEVYDKLVAALALGEKSAGATTTKTEPVFIFDPALLITKLRDLEEEFVRTAGGEDSELARSVYDAWLRGVQNASGELGLADIEGIVAAIGAKTRIALVTRGLELVRDATIRTLREDILTAFQNGVYDGQNPRDVARALRVRFDAHETDWVRLAQSEIASAQGKGKLESYAEMGIEEYNWEAPAGACPTCAGYAAKGPYLVGTGPLPMDSSHPRCRCSVSAVVPKD